MDTLLEVMSRIEDYTSAYKLCLNPDKSQIIILITKDKGLKD